LKIVTDKFQVLYLNLNMKNSLKILFVLVAFAAMILSAPLAKAQCATCAATVESNAKAGDTTTNGLNKGILFLLAAPYLIVAVGGYVWYKNYRRKNVNIAVRSEKLNLN
jgi:hypothetical protein